MRGDCIGNNEALRKAHNSFSVPDPFVSDKKQVADDDDDVFHFVSFLPIGSAVYELDGLKPGPVNVGAIGAGQVRCKMQCVSNVTVWVIVFSCCAYYVFVVSSSWAISLAQRQMGSQRRGTMY